MRSKIVARDQLRILTVDPEDWYMEVDYADGTREFYCHPQAELLSEIRSQLRQEADITGAVIASATKVMS